MALDGGEHVDEERQELQVAHRVLARSQQDDARVGRQAPVVVLARAVDALEGFRLLMEQYTETVTAGYLFHQAHEQHVLVVGKIAFTEDGSTLKLVGSHLVVASLHRDAETVSLNLKIFHEGLYAGGNLTEIMVVHLLVLGRSVAQQRAAAGDEVGTRGVEPVVHEEVLLLPAEVGLYLLDVGVEHLADGQGGVVHGLESLLERRLVVERLARVADEDRRDAQAVVHDEDGRRGVPCRVAASLERGADAAARERRGVGLLLYERLALELLYHAALPVVFHEGVVLLGCRLRQGLEPVAAVRHAVLQGPRLHAGSHFVGYVRVERRAVVDAVDEFVVGLHVKIFVHLFAIEHQFAEILRRTRCRCRHLDGVLFESFLYDFKSQFAHIFEDFVEMC